MMKKVLIVFGTRPEAIKMAPLIKEFKKNHRFFKSKVCVTAQHRQMLDQVLTFFELTPDFDLNIMKHNQDLYSLTSNIISLMKPVLEEFKPDLVFVHGDTTTSMAVSIASFYSGAKVCHVEAGLRTNNKVSPFPEEMNRQITSRIADFHFAPTSISKQNLLKENINEKHIMVTGNTVIDALLQSVIRVNKIQNDEINILKSKIDFSKKIILVTGHRRENHGDGVIKICEALKEIAIQNEDIEVVYPVHLNPNVKEPVFKLLERIKNIKLLSPLNYPAFVWLMKKSFFIISDSGGVQEEAPSLGKPVLVTRENTERPEGIQTGTAILVGTNKNKIIRYCNLLLNDKNYYKKMSQLTNPYGDGKASEKIIKFLLLNTF